MKQKAYHRFDIDNKTWEKISPYLMGQRGQHSEIAKDRKEFINAVVWILRTGASWQGLSPDYVKRRQYIKALLDAKGKL